MLWYSINDFRDFMFTASCRWGQPTPSLPNTATKRKKRRPVHSNLPTHCCQWATYITWWNKSTLTLYKSSSNKATNQTDWVCYINSVCCAGRENKSSHPPLHSLLQLSLLADLWELFLVVLPHLALLGSAPWVVFNALHLLLPSFH